MAEHDSKAAPEAGKLLVATPTLEDPNFHRSVVLLLAAGAEGAIGVVLNRTNDVPVEVLLPGWERLAAEPRSVFVGGPVARSSVICLGRLGDDAAEAAEAGGEPDGFQPVAGLLGTVDLNRDPESLGAGVVAVRLFSGYSGWGAGQLRGEIESGSWLVLDLRESDAFTDDPDGLWRRVLRRQGGRLAIYANAPPSL
ncbi:MAG TPA: YqgE/AlgH family protein, partial [Acidimicrobiales bacterium]|nr:YqgE/AlgH family protein [Acidimicrobiales bacterium]